MISLHWTLTLKRKLVEARFGLFLTLPRQMQPGMMQPGMMYPGMMPMKVQGEDAGSLQEKMEAFNNGVIVKQKIDLLEVLTGFDMPNVYEVWKKDANNKKTKHRQSCRSFPPSLFVCKKN